MFLRFHEMKERKEGGFTLIELLVVVLIIAILAAIAIPVFLNQRRKAWRSQSQSDLKNAAIAIEDCSVDANGDYGGAYDLEGDGVTDGNCNVESDLEADYGFNPSSDVTLVVTSGDINGYCLTATHANLGTDSWATATYDSNEGLPETADAC